MLPVVPGKGDEQLLKIENRVVLPPVQHALVAVQLVCNGGAIYFHAGSEHDKLKPLGYLSDKSLYYTDKAITWLVEFSVENPPLRGRNPHGAACAQRTSLGGGLWSPGH